MKSAINEERLIKHLETKIRKIIHETLKESLPNEIYYPPESKLKRSFVKRVLEAERRVKEGKGKSFKNIKEFKRYLHSLKEE